MNVAYKQLDDCPVEYKKDVATRLKTYWQEKHRWTKKEVGKQWKKVRDRNDKLEGIIAGS